MTKITIISIINKRKMKRLKRISHRRNVENFPNLPESVYFGSDNLIIFIKLIIRLHRYHPSFMIRPRDHTVERKNIYSETSLPTIILIKILILISQISIQRRQRQRLIRISNYQTLISLTSIRLGHTLFIFYIFD
jgi:hypothetical protein